MKSLLKITVIFIFVLYSYAEEKSPHTINFFFKPVPVTKKSASDETAMQKYFGIPSYVNGIFVAYAGDYTFSKLNGQVILPRKHRNPKFKVLITPSITPVFEPEVEIPTRTINHWRLSGSQDKKTVPNAKYYSYELKEDPEIKMSYWDTEVLKLPKNRKIPHDAIIIFADPKYTQIRTGPAKISLNSPNFDLPDIFIKSEINNSLNAIHFLKIKKYFGKVYSMFKFDPPQNPTRYLEQIYI